MRKPFYLFVEKDFLIITYKCSLHVNRPFYSISYAGFQLKRSYPLTFIAEGL